MKTAHRPPQQTDSARRRLLRGSFSVPAILTLTSGSALAAQSATCLVKATSTPSTAGIINSNSQSLDTLMRVKLRKDSSNVYFVARSDLGVLPVALTLWNASTAWQRFGIDSLVSTQYNRLYGTQESTALPANTQVNLWVALRFDATGSVVGMGLSGTGSVVGGSCWTSIKTQGL